MVEHQPKPKNTLEIIESQTPAGPNYQYRLGEHTPNLAIQKDLSAISWVADVSA